MTMQICRISVLILFLGINSGVVQAQTYPPIAEPAFLNTRWKFTYSAHVASDEVIFRAEDGYTHYIWFKYDGRAHTYFNGDISEDVWRLRPDKNTLEYSFGNMRTWSIAQFNNNTLALEFKMGDTTAYRYYFVNADAEELPFFVYGPNELPEAKVNRVITGKDPHPYRYVKDEPGKRLRQATKSSKSEAKKDSLQKEAEFMQIELVGGGFFGGPDPVYRNHITIKTDGKVIREYQTEKMGLQVWRSKISRKNLEELILYIEKKSFFDMQQIYTCSTNDCMTRMREAPKPIALRLAVTKGSIRKVITVSVWEGLGKQQHFVTYPPEIDFIIKAIEDVTMMPLNN